MNTDPIPAITIPDAVNALAVTPILLRNTPIGSNTLSTPFRNLPSNT